MGPITLISFLVHILMVTGILGIDVWKLLAMKRRNYSTNSVPLYGGSIHSTNFWGSRIQRGKCKVGGEIVSKMFRGG